jgi:hypothetical protein
MASVERRKLPRFVVDIPVQLLVGGRTLPGHVVDICRDAAWVESEASCSIDTIVSVNIEFPGAEGDAIDIIGRVIRVGAGEKAPHGMALLFTGLTPAAATRIDFFIDQQSEG